jgi:hypothetical protein
MNKSKQGHHILGGLESESVQQDHRPYWKRAHRDWRIWVAVLFMIAGMIVYVMSEDLSVRPRDLPQQPKSGAVRK